MWLDRVSAGRQGMFLYAYLGRLGHFGWKVVASEGSRPTVRAGDAGLASAGWRSH